MSLIHTAAIVAIFCAHPNPRQEDSTVGGKGLDQYSWGQYSGMTARHHAAHIHALVHILLLGLRTVRDGAWLYPFRWRVHHTLAVRVIQGASLLMCPKKISGKETNIGFPSLPQYLIMCSKL